MPKKPETDTPKKKAKQEPKNKKIPMRTCCGCRGTFPKKELVRIVRVPEGDTVLDPGGRMNGRGAYICKNAECLEKAFKKGSIRHTLGAAVSDEIYQRLAEELKSIEA